MSKSTAKQTLERIKSVILVVLVLFTILLLYFFWEDISFRDISFKTFNIMDRSEKNPVLNAADVLYPSEIVLTFNAGVATVIDEGGKPFWIGGGEQYGAGFLSCLSEFFQTDSIVVKETDEVEYETAMAYRSIRAKFDYYVPFKGFCDMLSIKRAPGYENVEVMSELAYSEQSAGSLYVHDRQNGKYYKLISKSALGGFTALLNMAEASEYTTYDPLEMILGEGMGNGTLVPLMLTSDLSPFAYKQELYPGEEEEDKAKIAAIAKDFFGGNFDFVRKIEEESGAVTYMYGYGERVLIAGTDGTFEYKEETENSQVQTNYFDALNIALRYIALHGGFETMDGQKLNPRLSTAAAVTDKGKGFRFSFDFDVNGHALRYEDGAPLTVEVIGTQVTYFRRDFISFNQEKAKGAEKEAYSIVNILSQSYSEIYDILLAENAVLPVGRKQDRFTPVGQAVSGVSCGYVRLSGRENEEIRPAWIIQTGGGRIDLYFDLYEPVLLGYSLR